MLSFLLFYGSWYLGIGFVSAWLINQAIVAVNRDEPFTSGEIAIAILLWPLNLGVFIFSFLNSFFK
jgi:hypothetical protein